MKIAVIGAKGLPAKQGGIEHYCAEVYPRMVAQGHSVDLFARCSYTENPWFHHTEHQGVQIISLPGLSLRGVDAFMTSAIGAIAASGNKYDIIHFHALGPSLFASIPRIASKGKVVVTCQGLDWQRTKWGAFSSRIIYTGEKSAIRFASKIVVVSKDLQSYFSQTYGRQTEYIPNAPATYPKSDQNFAYGQKLGLNKGKYILFLGRLVPEKRPDLLVEAFLKAKLVGWKLVLVGGVSDTRIYTSQLLSMMSSNRDIVYAGELWGERKAEIVRGAGLFVLPSQLEGLPLAMLEAMQEGVPVMGSDIPPHLQLLSDNRGILFAQGNLDSCIKSLSWAVEHPVELALMAKVAQTYVKTDYSWDKITSDYLRIYSELLKNEVWNESPKLVATSSHNRQEKLNV